MGAGCGVGVTPPATLGCSEGLRAAEFAALRVPLSSLRVPGAGFAFKGHWGALAGTKRDFMCD